MSDLLFQSLHPKAIQLSIIDRFTSDTLIRQEIQKLVPTDLIRVPVVQGQDQPRHGCLVNLDFLSQNPLELFNLYAIPPTHYGLASPLAWLELREVLLNLGQLLMREVEGMELLFRQVFKLFEILFDLLDYFGV